MFFYSTRTAPIYTTVKEHTYIVDRNLENAEPGNPDGARFGTSYHVEAQTRGSAYAHFKTFDNEEDAVALATRIAAAFAAGVSMDLDHWRFDRIPYGCDGWDEQEIANEIDDARRDGEQHPMDR
jgi:hypothetical protein